MHDTTNALITTVGQGHSVTSSRPTKSAVVCLLLASDLEDFVTYFLFFVSLENCGLVCQQLVVINHRAHDFF
jgi:hypothetical protein